MADEPRRSGRATKGQHKNASSSPAPNPKPKAAKSKPVKKATEPEPEEEEEEDEVRCICENNNPNDKRAFIGCDACSVWQHNICMGITDDEEDIPEHYFCEQCRPEEHVETLQALAKNDPIWETRNKIWQNEKKSKNRKNKSRNDQGPPGWLKKDVPVEPEPEPEPEPPVAPVEPQETSNKRKRDDVKEEPQRDVKEETKRPARQDKRRKSSPQETKDVEEADPDTALVGLDKLPSERQKVAEALIKIITENIQSRPKGSFKIPAGETAKSFGEHHGLRVEYAMHINYGGQEQYKTQFRALHANLKKNKVLVERLVNGSITADELSTMESKDMASEELQRERAEMKAELDRQAIALKNEGPKIRRTHKGDEIIEDETQVAVEPVANNAPVRERPSVAEEADGSPAQKENIGSPAGKDQGPLAINTSRPSNAGHERRQSSHQFDMNSIWAKTAQSPTAGTPPGGPRPMQVPPRRRSSVQAQPNQPDGAKHDPDVDRMLEDNDEPYSPTEFTSDSSIVWRGKLVQSSGDGEPTVNARFVAGRDLGPTITWKDLIPHKLNIDGRLQIAKAEEYLCSLEWSTSSDVSVLALSPYDNAPAFDTVFNYFKSRERYAVVHKHTPPMVKDLYIIPLEIGGSLPEHVGKLEHCTIKMPVDERLLLATFVVARAPGEAPLPQEISTPSAPQNGSHIPPYIRGQGPAGSPLNAQTPVFSPSMHPNNGAPVAGYGVPPPQFPPNPYTTQTGPGGFAAAPSYSTNPLVNEILGPLQDCPTAQQILSADPHMGHDKLRNLHKILMDDERARTDLNVLAAELALGGRK